MPARSTSSPERDPEPGVWKYTLYVYPHTRGEDPPIAPVCGSRNSPGHSAGKDNVELGRGVPPGAAPAYREVIPR